MAPKWKEINDSVEDIEESPASKYFQQQKQIFEASQKARAHVHHNELDHGAATGKSDPTFEDVFEGIFDEALELLIERQRKYGPDNIANQGIYGIITRIADDKIARVRTSLNGTVVNGRVVVNPIVDREAQDTFEDALLDIANYALIAIALKRGLWGKPMRAPVAQRKERLPSKQ